MTEAFKIAIVGSGISGLTAAWVLCRHHDITLFEANDYAGGHTHTVDVTVHGIPYAVDTGFIVFNEVTYPNFCKILKRLGVASQPTAMTFSVKCERTGLEYNAHSLNTFFGQRKNMLSPSFYRMILDIFRFRYQFDRLLNRPSTAMTLGAFLRRKGYGQRFIHQFIIPMGAALWSADPERIHEFPLQMFVRFFRNHGLLSVKNPFQWRVVRGGSRQYVNRLTAAFADRIRLNAAVCRICRHPDHVELSLETGDIHRFDHVVLAVHSDQALALLEDPTDTEREVLSSFAYQPNLTILHTDTSVLPRRRSLWASWNYLIPREPIGRAALTYDMNILQSIRAPVEFCVTLNRPDAIGPGRVIDRFDYHHPIYTLRAEEARKRQLQISGNNRTHYCGAYWGYGFHEDGVNSALAACRYFKESL